MNLNNLKELEVEELNPKELMKTEGGLWLFFLGAGLGVLAALLIKGEGREHE